jgi:hypothetical protein
MDCTRHDESGETRCDSESEGDDMWSEEQEASEENEVGDDEDSEGLKESEEEGKDGIEVEGELCFEPGKDQSPSEQTLIVAEHQGRSERCLLLDEVYNTRRDSVGAEAFDTAQQQTHSPQQQQPVITFESDDLQDFGIGSIPFDEINNAYYEGMIRPVIVPTLGEFCEAANLTPPSGYFADELWGDMEGPTPFDC